MTEKMNTSQNLNPEKEISKLLSELLKTNSEFQNKVFSVGGFVRDQLLNIESNDLDLVIEIFGGAQKFACFLNSQFKNETTTPFQKGFGYPIWFLQFKADVVFNQQIYKTATGSIDFADTQKECFPDPTTRQRITSFGTLFEDIQRRDFTINMLAENLTTHEIIDLSGAGLNDLKSGVLKTHPLTHPDQVFSDDPLRMIRAIRFSTKYDFKIAPAILDSIQKNKQRIDILSSERVWDELKKIILNGKLKQALQLFKETQIDSLILKNLNPLEINPDGYLMAKNDIALNLFILLKKQPAEKVSPFLAHLKIEVSTQKNVQQLLKASVDYETHSSTWTLAQYRSFFRKFRDQISTFEIIHPEIATAKARALKIPLQKSAVLNGHDVMRLFKIQGSRIQTILNRALELEDELILRDDKQPADPDLQNEVLNTLKAEFLNA